MTSIAETSNRVLKVVIAIFFLVYHSARSALLRLVGHRSTGSLVVLMYHSVKRHERARFASQMDRVLRIADPVYADFKAADTTAARYIAVTFDDALQSVLDNAWPILQERGIPTTLFVPTQDLGRWPGWITDDHHRNADERVLTRDELRYLQTCGVLIGSHSVTHRRLAQVSSADASTELAESRKVLHEISGRDVELFAFPYGSSNAELIRLAAGAGYRRVFLNVPVRARAEGGTDVIGRIEVCPTDWPLEYYLKIRGAYQWLPKAMATKRRFLSALRTLSAVSIRRTVRHPAPRAARSHVERSAL